MSLWETLTGWIDRDRSQLAYLNIHPEQVERTFKPVAIEAGVHYVRLRLAGMFLKKGTSWFKDWHPAVHSTVRLTFGSKELEIPGIADSTRVGLQPTGGGDVIARNFLLTPTLPFNGGTISLNAGLIALPGDDHLKGFLKTLGNFSGLLGVAQLSAALNIVQPLAEGIQELFTSGSRLHLGLYDTFAAGELKAGYMVAVRAPQQTVTSAYLWVIGDTLHEGATLEEARRNPFESHDYMLLRVEVFDKRDDWEHLASIQEPFQEALKALRGAQSNEESIQHMRTALLRAIQSPELTETDRKRVVQSLKERYEAFKKTLDFSGALGEIVTLKDVMRAPMSVKAARDLDEPTPADVFRLIPSEAPRRRSAAMHLDVDSPAVSGIQRGGGNKMAKPIETPAPEPIEAPAPSFNFALKGAEAKRDQVVSGAQFQLVFDYGVAGADALAKVHGDILEAEVAKGDFDLDVTIIPKGFIFTDSVFTRKAKFRGGKFESAVVFNLRASADPVEESGLHVMLEVRGNLLYEFFLPVRLVEALDETGASETPLPDLDLDDIKAALAREQSKVRLLIFADGDKFRVTYDDPAADVPLMFDTKIVTRNYLADALPEVREYLDPVPANQIWNLMDEPLAAPSGEKAADELRDCTERVVTAGWLLYQKLSADEEFREVLDAIFALKPGSRLSIKTDCAFIPWEILYPEEYNVKAPQDLKDENPMQPQKLLGNCLNIECLLAGANKNYKAPNALHESSPPYVSFNLFSTIDNGYQGSAFLPGASHEALSQTFAAAGVRTEVWKNGADIKANVINKKGHEATLIYFFCHGQNDKPLNPQQREKLEIDKGDYIAPLDVPRRLGFPRAPLIFLNSCSSGAISPHNFSNFLSAFKEKRAVGLVATSFPVPIKFASAFGQEFIRRYVREKQTAGDALFDMRRELLGKGNPLGLFYTIQCPMDIKSHTS